MPTKIVEKLNTCGADNVVPMAINMPITAYMLPIRAVTGDDSPRNAMMKHTLETKYANAE